MGLVLDVGARQRGFGLASLDFAHRPAVEREPVGIVDDAIEDGVGESGFADHLVPGVGRQLAGDECRAPSVTVLDDWR